MTLTCPYCKTSIDIAHVNVNTDLAKCTNCNTMHNASDLVKAPNITGGMQPPKGSKIEMKKGLGDNIEIFLPQKGGPFANIPINVVASFSLVGIAGWIFWAVLNAAHGMFTFAILTPFWLIAVARTAELLDRIYEKQTIKLSLGKLTITRSRPIRSTTVEIEFNDIQYVQMMHNSLANGSHYNTHKLFRNFAKGIFKQGKELSTNSATPTIITTSRIEHFFESASETEQEWVSQLVDAVVKKGKKP